MVIDEEDEGVFLEDYLTVGRGDVTPLMERCEIWTVGLSRYAPITFKAKLRYIIWASAQYYTMGKIFENYRMWAYEYINIV